MFSLIYACINDWVNNREAGDLRRQRGHYDVIVMYSLCFNLYGHHSTLFVKKVKKSFLFFAQLAYQLIFSMINSWVMVHITIVFFSKWSWRKCQQKNLCSLICLIPILNAKDFVDWLCGLEVVFYRICMYNVVLRKRIRAMCKKKFIFHQICSVVIVTQAVVVICVFAYPWTKY